mmetsp:Transcript_492/g.1147  ORF Transcript_492/g.1147 Transcript_492/m.1147 type:complete len:630 (-) Transcript_492:619-2508(-)
MAAHMQSFCIIHPGSETDSGKFVYGDTHVEIDLPHAARGEVNGGSAASSGGSRRETFVFDRVFAPATAQEKVFQEAARAPVLGAIDHFVSAAFIAFGGSGSGKTFAITGGAKRFADRGLIPRSISALFEALSARADRGDFEVSVSFYEIYKDAVVDLLSERRRRVTLQTDQKGPKLVGLTKQTAATESDAYHLLFQGDSNRHFERLPLNAETSRGHVFYVLHLANLPTGREATLSFIDLAATISMKNHATASITRSLEALRVTVSAIGTNRRPPFEASVLTQLLEPWLKPNPRSLVHVACILPAKYMEQMADEIGDWFHFARLFHEAMQDQSQRDQLQQDESSVVGDLDRKPDVQAQTQAMHDFSRREHLQREDYSVANDRGIMLNVRAEGVPDSASTVAPVMMAEQSEPGMHCFAGDELAAADMNGIPSAYAEDEFGDGGWDGVDFNKACDVQLTTAQPVRTANVMPRGGPPEVYPTQQPAPGYQPVETGPVLESPQARPRYSMDAGPTPYEQQAVRAEDEYARVTQSPQAMSRYTMDGGPVPYEQQPPRVEENFIGQVQAVDLLSHPHASQLPPQQTMRPAPLPISGCMAGASGKQFANDMQLPMQAQQQQQLQHQLQQQQHQQHQR